MKKQNLLWILLLFQTAFYFTSCKQDKKDGTPIPEKSIDTVFKDPRDGKAYRLVTIKNQTWFAENLAYVGQFAYGRGIYAYANPDSGKKYGGLYDWDAAMIACPKGWHLPSNDEWKILELNSGVPESQLNKFSINRGDKEKVGTKLKKGGELKFDMLLFDGDNYGLDIVETWTATNQSKGYSYNRLFWKYYDGVSIDTSRNEKLLCVRCLKD